jgi:signal transduction histidine kinase
MWDGAPCRAEPLVSLWRDVSARAVVRWFVLLALPLFVWPVLAWLHTEPNAKGALVLRDADFVAGATTHPPAQSATRERRSLPDDWRRHGGGIREGWYTLRFHVDRADDAEWAVFLPTVRMNAAVYLDGALVGDGGRFDEPVARNWQRPLLWSLASPSPMSGAHVLHLRLRTDIPDTGLLGPVYVGPREMLEPLYAYRRALRHDAVWVITLCLVIVGAFTASLWTRWRDASYGWFATAAFAWAVIHLNVLVVDIPVGATTWWGGWYLALIAWVVTLTRFLLAFIDVQAPHIVRGVWWLAAIGVAALGLLTLLGSPLLHVAASIWMTLALLVLAYGVIRVRLLRARGEDLATALPHVLGLTVAGCAVHDWLVLLGVAGPTYDYFLPYAAPPVFVGMGWALLRRFVGALEESAALVADLEQRVAAKRAELARSYERLHAVARARVLAEERERIMREMHDGLGSHLVSTLALLESDGTARHVVGDAVRAALDDLRLMIDALVPLDGDLLGALALLRARMQPRLEAAGIRVEWRVSDLPRLADLGAPQVLQVMRILQEAVTNVLKHANARTLIVRTDVGAPRGVSVEIADDGRGLDGASAGGRGFQNMQRRADAIGAALEIVGTPPGTRVRLHIPIVAETRA